MRKRRAAAVARSFLTLEVSRCLDILNYHFIYNLPASFLCRFGNNVILLLVDFVLESRALAQNVIKVT